MRTLKRHHAFFTMSVRAKYGTVLLCRVCNANTATRWGSHIPTFFATWAGRSRARGSPFPPQPQSEKALLDFDGWSPMHGAHFERCIHEYPCVTEVSGYRRQHKLRFIASVFFCGRNETSLYSIEICFILKFVILGFKCRISRYITNVHILLASILNCVRQYS